MENSGDMINPGTGGDRSRDSSNSSPLPGADERLQRALDKALYAGGSPGAQKVRNFLNGTWLGEPLHVVLKDVPVGAWTVAMVLDVLDLAFDRPELAVAADTSVAIGIAGAWGAALTGATDWSDVDPPARRLGLTHGLLNLGGTALFVASLLLRRKKSRKSGRVVGALGFAVMAYASHLGGKLVYRHRVGVDRTAGQAFPDHFVAVFAESALEEGKPTRTTYQGVPILLVRRGENVYALADTCSHFGGPLSDGKLAGTSIVCPYHSSRFNLADGRVLDGPAVHPQPCLEVRVRDGQIEVRKAFLAAGDFRLRR